MRVVFNIPKFVKSLARRVCLSGADRRRAYVLQVQEELNWPPPALRFSRNVLDDVRLMVPIDF